MTEAYPNASQSTAGSPNPERRRGAADVAVHALVPFLLALGAGSSLQAGERNWSLQLEPMYMEAYGHDQHVLTIHELDLDSTPRVESKAAVSLDTDAAFAFRGEFQYRRKQWRFGVDLFQFLTSQSAPNRTAAATGPSGASDRVSFEVPDRVFVSTHPGETLFYGILEDTDLEMWTVDLYGMRTLAENEEGGIHLQFGLRVGDFDNDYHAVVGIQGASGSQLDSSSNYDLMMGPLVGLAADVQLGKSYVKAYLGQSVLIGSNELTSMSRDFTGPFGAAPSFVDQEVFKSFQDVAIPITELRIKWTYRVSKMVAVGVGANTSAWWDVPVPPGVIPREGGDALDENSIVLLGLLGAVELSF